MHKHLCIFHSTVQNTSQCTHLRATLLCDWWYLDSCYTGMSRYLPYVGPAGLYRCLSRRVDMRAVESSIQRLIGNGLDPQLENNPYLCFIYTSFQVCRACHGAVVLACTCSRARQSKMERSTQPEAEACEAVMHLAG